MNKEFHDMLFTRHSIRKYTDEPIDGEHVKLLLEAALLAPSGKSVRPWEFVVVEDKEVLAKMSECRPFGSGPVAKCKLAIVVCGDPGKTDVWVEDCTIAATYIQLQAEALGLGSCWIQMRGRFDKDNNESADLIRELLDIPGEQQVECIIVLGHKDEVRRPVDPDKLLWEKVHIGKF
ncbi:MAG: nitroreductase family protein [Muribaculaceae bacterium]